jgi:Na+/proline symporter
VQAARKMMGVSLITNAGVQLLLAAVGFALLAYFTARPELLPNATGAIGNADRLFPSFIVSGLPIGMSGLIIAGLLSAAMSSLSSGLNSACAVISVDLLDRRRSDGTTSADNVALSRWVSVGVGMIVLALSTGVTLVQGNLLELTYKVVNLLVCPLFGLFVMAIFIRRATGCATIIGAAAGLITVSLINYWTELTGNPSPVGFLWAMPLGLLVQVTVGVAATWLPWGRSWESLDDFRTRRNEQPVPTCTVRGS